jgi:uncharacterized protein (DUF2267 family)
MTATGLDAFDNTVQKTNIWLREVGEELGSDDRHLAYSALRATLHALRDRLPPNEAVHLGAQLPMLIRGFYYEGWHPADKPIRSDRGEFLRAIREHVGRGLGTPEPLHVAHAVFRVLALHVTEGELRDVRHALPKDVRELWQ